MSQGTAPGWENPATTPNQSVGPFPYFRVIPFRSWRADLKTATDGYWCCCRNAVMVKTRVALGEYPAFHALLIKTAMSRTKRPFRGCTARACCGSS